MTPENSDFSPYIVRRQKGALLNFLKCTAFTISLFTCTSLASTIGDYLREEDGKIARSVVVFSQEVNDLVWAVETQNGLQYMLWVDSVGTIHISIVPQWFWCEYIPRLCPNEAQ